MGGQQVGGQAVGTPVRVGGTEGGGGHLFAGCRRPEEGSPTDVEG